MYGLVIESIVAFIRKTYGDDKWMEIRKCGKIDQHSFSTHLIYPETTIPKLVETASDLLGISREDFLTNLGRFFVTFVSQYGYDKILRVLGRHMRDFLNGLDNLHEYMRFSYPKLKPPSFFVEKETEHGLILHYRSKRRYGGYVRYVMGQIKSVGDMFYGLDIDIEMMKEEFVGNMVHVTMQLRFDNSAFLTERTASQDTLDEMKIESDLFFEAFPFHIVFTEDMIIKSAGVGLSNVMSNIEGHDISHIFILRRPMVEFAWEQVLSHTNNVFELESMDCIQKKEDSSFVDIMHEEDSLNKLSFESESDPSDDNLTPIEGMKLHLKGQMIWTPEWQAILFLGTPVLPHLTAMFDTGLFINDLSLHDNSRDLVLAGTQTSAELKLALDQEQVKSKKLEDNMKKLDEEMRRTDELLYQMIPRQIADRLRAGEPALDTCQVFDHVTILFSDVVGFTMICSRISPLQVVNMLNSMYSKFDHLCALHETYKVETIGDAYVVVSGAPEEVDDHAERIADMALGMIDTMQTLMDPSTGNHLQIRVGLNSGVVVAGVVGLKMPRYCLFGDTVNTAAKMESSSEHMRIQMTQATMEFLKDNKNYVATERGLIDIKDKGKMYTYWLAASVSYKSRITHNAEQRPKVKAAKPRGTDSRGSVISQSVGVPVTDFSSHVIDGKNPNYGAETAVAAAGVRLPSSRTSSDSAHPDHAHANPTPVLIYDSQANVKDPFLHGTVAPMFESVRTSPRHIPEGKQHQPTVTNTQAKRSVGSSSPDSPVQPALKKVVIEPVYKEEDKPVNGYQTDSKPVNGVSNRVVNGVGNGVGNGNGSGSSNRIGNGAGNGVGNKAAYANGSDAVIRVGNGVTKDGVSGSGSSEDDEMPVVTSQTSTVTGSSSTVAPSAKRELSSPVQPPAQRPADVKSVIPLDRPVVKPANSSARSARERRRTGIMSSESSSYEYEGGDAGHSGSDSDDYSPVKSTECSRRESLQKVAPPPSTTATKEPIFSIRQEDYVSSEPKEPPHMTAARRPMRSNLKEVLGSEQLFSKILAAKTAPVQIHLSRRPSQDMIPRRVGQDADHLRGMPIPVISVSYDGSQLNAVEENQNGTNEAAKKEIANQPTSDDVPTKKSPGPHPVKSMHNLTAREKLAQVATPHKKADVTIASSPTPEKHEGEMSRESRPASAATATISLISAKSDTLKQLNVESVNGSKADTQKAKATTILPVKQNGLVDGPEKTHNESPASDVTAADLPPNPGTTMPVPGVTEVPLKEKGGKSIDRKKQEHLTVENRKKSIAGSKVTLQNDRHGKATSLTSAATATSRRAIESCMCTIF